MNHQSVLRQLPLTRRLVLVVSALLAVSIAAVIAVAFHELKTSEELAETARITRSVQRVGSLFEAGARGRAASIRRTALLPPIHDAVLNGMSSKVVDSILHARVRTDSTLGMAILSADGRIIASAGPIPNLVKDLPPEVILRMPGDTVISSPLIIMNGVPRTWTATTIRDGSHAIGILAQERPLRVTPQVVAVLDTLFLNDAKLYIRNRTGSTQWATLLGELVPVPANIDTSGDVVAYMHNGEEVLSASADLAGTPLSVVAEVPRSAALIQVRHAVRTLIAVSLVVLLVAIVITALIGRRISKPVLRLTEAADAISQGEYARRVALDGDDEVGRLAVAFDKMAGEVESAAENREALYRASVALRIEAESANRAKSEFLATMSHEIRTPINAMMGYTELIRTGISGPLTDKQAAQLERIRASGLHLTSLIDEMLDLAKIEARQMKVVRKAISTAESAEHAIRNVRPQAEAKRIELCMSSHQAPTYVADPSRVEQILTNLLSNAVKFTGAGGKISLDWGTETVPVDGTTAEGVWISVSDTGIGIAPGQFERIFQPFIQVENGYTRGQGGTGLGLAISRQLALLMGGGLTVESEVGSGSKFTVHLPMAHEAVATAT